ncbi:MAG: hypothetical protein E6G94_13515 [Alphaproteobacteria bacterium]|nr:MAG: hypothetical protein E6G94_13515 [Alphaproteobacteria bacterium]
MLPAVVELRRTSTAGPSQWEGRLADGRSLYIRFRHDELSVHVGPIGGNVDAAVAALPWLDLDLSSKEWDGLIEIDDVLAVSGLTLSSALKANRDQL